VRKVTIEVTCRIVREYPDDWTDESIEFHCNDSSSCANNLLRDFAKQLDEPGSECACWQTEARVVKE
jgi:hypothetical protein